MKCPDCMMDNAKEARFCRYCNLHFATRTRSKPPGAGSVGNYFGFRQMVTPFWIQISYVLGITIIVTVAAVAIAFPYLFATASVEDLWVRAGGVLLLLVGNLIWRVLCEGAIVVFRMYSLLMSLDDRARWIGEMEAVQQYRR